MMGNTSVVVYSSNNSGGDWWLSDEDWLALEKAGWVVEWVRDNPNLPFIKNDRWLGALARSAHREGLTLHEAIEEWEGITGQNSAELGCPCCGQPHGFRMR